MDAAVNDWYPLASFTWIAVYEQNVAPNVTG